MQTLNLTALVELSRTNPNAVEYIQERLRQAEERGDRRAAQMARLAIRHAMRKVEG